MKSKNEIHHWAESNNRTHVLYVEVKSKGGKWIKKDKIYSQEGFGPEDLEKYYNAYVLIYNPFEVRILNALQKQVYSEASNTLKLLFNPTSFNIKLISIKKPDEKFYIENLIDISDNLDELKYRIIDESDEHDGIRSISSLIYNPEDNFLKWFKIHFNDGYRLHVALYT